MTTQDEAKRNQAGKVANLADEAAIRWLARLKASDVTDAERAQFALWLAQDDAHKAAFDQISLLWAGLGALGSELDDEYVVPEPLPEQPAPEKTRGRATLAVAASIAVAACTLVRAKLACGNSEATVRPASCSCF